MNTYAVRRSRLCLWIGYLLAEGALLAILLGLLIIWYEEPSYLNWPLAVFSWVTVWLFFHCLLFTGTFYRVQVHGEQIECHGFLRKPKQLCFSDICKVEPSIGLDVKVIGHNRRKLFDMKQTDRNFDRFMMDLSAHMKK